MVITAMIKSLANNFNIWVISGLAQHLLIIFLFENLSHFSFFFVYLTVLCCTLDMFIFLFDSLGHFKILCGKLIYFYFSSLSTKQGLDQNFCLVFVRGYFSVTSISTAFALSLLAFSLYMQLRHKPRAKVVSYIISGNPFSRSPGFVSQSLSLRVNFFQSYKGRAFVFSQNFIPKQCFIILMTGIAIWTMQCKVKETVMISPYTLWSTGDNFFSVFLYRKMFILLCFVFWILYVCTTAVAPATAVLQLRTPQGRAGKESRFKIKYNKIQ